MTRIHLLMRKEEIDQQKLSENNVVVVFDILLATSTITVALEYGAKEVIPVLNCSEAREVAKKINQTDAILIGEYNGITIEGFHPPNPFALKKLVSSKSIILSTTNGTIAIRNSCRAKKVYAASILNSQSVAKHIYDTKDEESILLICAGSSGEFNIEDFYGAGYLIDCLLNESINLEMTDAAKSALYFYKGLKDKEEEILLESKAGKMMLNYGYEEDLKFVAHKSMFHAVPIVEDGYRIKNANYIEKTCL